MTTMPESEVKALAEGTLGCWMEGYEHMDPGDGLGERQFKIVLMSWDDRPEETFWEIRDHNNGQEIVGRFKITVNVERIGE
jgi:hypothetical protein